MMNADARLTTLTRLGFAARGLLYIVIALLLIRAGRSEDPSGALGYLAQGGGGLLMIAIAAGFIGYGLWRLSDALFNIEGHSSDNKGLRERLGAGGSGIVHLLLAWQAVKLIRGAEPASDGATQDSARTALEIPGGEVALLLAGLVLLAVGAFQVMKAVKGHFLRHLEPQIASQPWAKWAGKLGYAARGLVFLISGGFLIKAGLEARASEAGGIEEALAWLDSPWDVLIAIGLFCFGLYSLIEARFRILHGVPVDAITHGDVRPNLR
ncbi:MAG TPA: DUF1206 domain-containing protein [Sphingomicrobium sp.]|nr:DUF1206 domain-containing protein [Sphingomicrobium sp.]